MSTPSIIERITDAIEELISAYEDDEYVHQKLMEIHALFDERFFSNALDMLQDLKEQITPTDPELYTLLENDISRVVKAKNKVKHDKQVALGQQLDVIAPSLKEEPKKIEEPEPKKRKKTKKPVTKAVMDTFRPDQLKVGRKYRVILVNKDSVHRKEKKMKKPYKMLDDGPQIWTLQNIGAVYYTFDTKGDIEVTGSNVAVEDVTLEEVVLKPVPDPPELLDGMLIQVKWDGYPVLTQMYRNVVYAESPIVFVTYNTRTPIGNQPFNPTDPDEQWNYPEYIDLNNVTEIEFLDCGQYADEIKLLKPVKGSKVNVCVAKLNTGEVRVLIPDELSNGDLSRSFDKVAVQEHVESTDFIECRVIKVGKTACTLEKYGEVPLGCILGVWREADVGETFESASEGSTEGVTPHLWNCEWKKNKTRFVLDLYYTEIRLPSVSEIETWDAPSDDEEDDDALEEGETYDYSGIEYVCKGEAGGEQKTDETVYKLFNKKLNETIYKTAQEIHDQIAPKFDLFDKRTQIYVLFAKTLWKVVRFNTHDRIYILESDDGETTRAHEKDIMPKPVLSYEIGQLVGYNYEFCKVSEVEVMYTLELLDQSVVDIRSTEADLGNYVTDITELELDEWCMYKNKIVRLKLENGRSVIEEKPDKKGKMIKHVKIFQSPKKKRPTTVKKSLVTFQPDIATTFVQERWNGIITKNTRVNVELKDNTMKKGVVVGWRESDKAEHATSDKYEIRFDDGSVKWYGLQKIEVVTEAVEDVEEQPLDAYNISSDSASSSESDSDSDSDHEISVDDEFEGKLVQVGQVAPLGLRGERVRDGDDEKIWTIVRDVTADDLNVKKLKGDQLDLYIIEQNTEQEMMHREDLIKVIEQLEGVELMKGEVFQAGLDGNLYKLTSCWRDFQITVPSMCLVFYEPDIVTGKPVYLLADETYTKHIVMSTEGGLYELNGGLTVNRAEIDVYVEPFKTTDTVHLKGSCYEVFKVTKVKGRTVDLESTWNPATKFEGVDMSNVSRSSEEYEPKDFVKVKATNQIEKVEKSKNNRVSLVGIKDRTFGPSELSPSDDPSNKESSDLEDSESGSESGSDNE